MKKLKITKTILILTLIFNLIYLPVIANAEMTASSETDAVLESNSMEDVSTADTPDEPKSEDPATGPIGQTGPQGPTGPQNETGVIGETGPIITDETSELTNDETGAKSINQNSISETSDLSLLDVNRSNKSNIANINMDSGQNALTKNTAVGSLRTGDNNSSLNLIDIGSGNFSPQSSVGSNSMLESEFPNGVLLTADAPLTRIAIPQNLTNSINGSNSQNFNQIERNNLFSFIGDNQSKKTNEIFISANTGRNLISENTSVKNVSTGNIGLGVNLLDLSSFHNPNAILNVDIWSLLNGLSGDLIIPTNTFTGNKSENDNVIQGDSNASIRTLDTSTSTNSLNVSTSTGENTVDKNSVVGDISSGQSKVDQNQFVIDGSKSGIYYIINVFGKFLGNILGIGDNVAVNEINGTGLSPISATNSRSGTGSENTNLIKNNSNIDIENIDSSNRRNSINIEANTGENKISKNTKIGNISTGSINVITNSIKLISGQGSNLAKIKIAVINIFGNLKGDIISSLEATKRREQKETQSNNLNNQSSHSTVSAVVNSGNSSQQSIQELTSNSTLLRQESSTTSSTIKGAKSMLISPTEEDLLPHTEFAFFRSDHRNEPKDKDLENKNSVTKLSNKDFSMPATIALFAMIIDALSLAILKKK